MSNISPTPYQKHVAKRYAKRLLFACGIGFTLPILASVSFEKPSQTVIAQNAFNTCQFDEALQHAKQLGLTVENTDRFGWFNFVGTKQAVSDFKSWYFHDEDKKGNTKKICDVHHLRELVKDAKPKLIPFIPINADYVSYHPTQNKAVYCRYNYHNVFQPSQNRLGSQCQYLTLEDNQVIRYDISNMERNNTQWWIDNHYYPQHIFQVASYIGRWEDKPTTYFGFQFLTVVNESPWGMGQDY